jgi:hypothetical protein
MRDKNITKHLTIKDFLFTYMETSFYIKRLIIEI